MLPERKAPDGSRLRGKGGPSGKDAAPEKPGQAALFEDLSEDVLQDAARQVVFLFNGRINADDDGHVKRLRVCGLHAQRDLLRGAMPLSSPRMEKVASFNGAMRS